MRKEQAESLRTLKCLGYKWNTQTVVGHNIELHIIAELNGRQYIQFVADLDSYGNVEFGLFDESRVIRSKVEQFNADGEVLNN